MWEKRRITALATAVLTLVLLSGTVHAFSSINLEPIDNRIKPGEKATYNLTIQNQKEEDQRYEIYSPNSGIGWSVKTQPFSDRQIYLRENQIKKTKIEVKPLENFDSGIYIINLNINTDSGESYQRPLKIYINAEGPRKYQPSIRTNIEMDKTIDPTQTQSIKVSLQNLNPLDLTNSTLLIKSDIPAVNTQRKIDLGPKESKTFEFSFNISNKQQPKEYDIFFQLNNNGEIVKVLNEKAKIKTVTPPFKKEVKTDEGYLKTTHEVEITNPGNVRNTQKVTVEIGSFQRFFTSSTPDSSYIEKDGKSLLSWKVSVGPEEKKTLKYSVSYRIPVFIIILGIIAAIIYLLYKSPVEVRKTATNVLLEESGGVSGLKIELSIKNRSDRTLRNVEIKDKIPSLADVKEDVEMGTLEPTKLLRDEKGRAVAKWNISELEGGEERIITYKIKSQLNIVGTLTLPRATVTFNDNGEKDISYSNKYRVSTE